MAKLVIFSPEGRQEVELRDHNSIGRHPNNSIQLLDRIVSKEHAIVLIKEGRFWFRDLGSLNGSFVNNERVQGEVVLKDGDEMTLGGTRMIFVDARPAEQGLHRVTIAPGMMESHIRTKFAALEHDFQPERIVHDVDALRRDYEKLRISYELQRAIGIELDLDKLLARVLERAFEVLPADRGVVLLKDPTSGELKPRAVKTRQAKADENIVLSTAIINEVVKEKAAVLSSDATVDSRFHGAHSIIMQGIRSTMAVPLIQKGDLLGIMVLDSQIATNAFTEKDLQMLSNIANQCAIFLENRRMAKRIEEEAITREKFQRLLSPVLAEQVVSGKLEVKRGGQAHEATVLFADIRGFTAMSEARTPQDVVQMLNEYFELMVEIIFKHEGTLDKFIGDEIMVLYGAPVRHDEHAHRAVRTALDMLDMLAEFNRTRMAEGQDAIRIGIGVNSGEVVAGYMGSSRTMEYTAIGDTVNTASRLCSLARPGEIIISEFTHSLVQEQFEVVPLPPTKVKGKQKPLHIFSVTGRKQPSINEVTNPGVIGRG